MQAEALAKQLACSQAEAAEACQRAEKLRAELDASHLALQASQSESDAARAARVELEQRAQTLAQQLSSTEARAQLLGEEVAAAHAQAASQGRELNACVRRLSDVLKANEELEGRLEKVGAWVSREVCPCA